MIRALFLTALLALGGCASFVEVRAADAPPKHSLWPLGVKIERGANDAIAVRQWSIGLWTTCYAAGVGFSASYCAVIDPFTCGVAIIEEGHSRPDNGWLAKVSDSVRASCLHEKKVTSP